MSSYNEDRQKHQSSVCVLSLCQKADYIFFNTGVKLEIIRLNSVIDLVLLLLPCFYLGCTLGVTVILVWFDDTSTIVGYLMPDPFLYIQNLSMSSNSV